MHEDQRGGPCLDSLTAAKAKAWYDGRHSSNAPDDGTNKGIAELLQHKRNRQQKRACNFQK